MLTPDAPFLVEDPQRREVDRLVGERLLEPLLPGIVAPTGCARDRDVRVAAAVLALPRRALERVALSQQAAAWIWCGGPPPRVLDLAVRPGRAVPRTPLLAVHERRMPPQDVVELAAGEATLTVTTPTRTLVDLLRTLPPEQAPAAAEPLALLPGVTLQGVTACLERMPRARGVPRARRLAAALRFGAGARRLTVGRRPVSRSASP